MGSFVKLDRISKNNQVMNSCSKIANKKNRRPKMTDEMINFDEADAFD